MSRKIIAILASITLLCSLMFTFGLFAAAEEITLTAYNTGGSNAGIDDWSSAWGIPSGTGMQVTVCFSKQFSDKAANTDITGEVAQYIVVNGISLADRIANKSKLGIAAVPENLWNSAVGLASVYSATEMDIRLLGGGLGNLKADQYNTVTLLADFPVSGGKLGKDVTLTFNPIDKVWTTSPYTPEVSIAASATPGSGQTGGFVDWSSPWGLNPGEGIEFVVNFGKDFTDAAANTSFSDTLAKYITVNGVKLSDRLANEASLGISTVPSGLWGGPTAVILNDSNTQLNIRLLGGGKGNIKADEYNILTLSAEFPFKDGSTLGQDVTLIYNPSTQVWVPQYMATIPEPSVPGSDVTITAGAYPTTGQVGFDDWSSAWNIDPGTGLELTLNFSEKVTDAAQYTNLIEQLGEFITINDVKLSDRYANDPSLEIAKIRDDLWGGKTAVINVYNSNELHVIMLGGGKGNLDITKENKITFSADFPLLDGTTLGNEITLTFDPETKVWKNDKELSIVYVTAGAYPGTPDSGFNDWSGAWGVPEGTGLELTITFSEPLTSALPQYTSLTTQLAQYITVNDIPLTDRIAKKAELGIADVPAELWGGNNTVLVSYTDYEMHIILIGGGTGNLDITKKNTVVFSKDMPMVGRTLGRDVTMIFDPELLVWDDKDLVNPDNPGEEPGGNDPEPTKPPLDREEADELTVKVGVPSDCGQKGIWDRSSELGLKKGKAMQLLLTFSGEYTNAATDSNLTTTLAPFITINGVTLDRRESADPYLYMDSVSDDLWGGYNVVLTNSGDQSSTQLDVILLGGGDGNLDKSKTNTIVLSADFPLPMGRTLGRELKFVYNPDSQTWTLEGAANPATGRTAPVVPLTLAVLSGFVLVTLYCKSKKHTA